MARRPSNLPTDAAGTVDRFIDTAYDTVKIVADNIDTINEIADAPYLQHYLGAYPANPTTRVDGTPIQDGDFYVNTTQSLLYYYDGINDVWIQIDTIGANESAINAQNSADSALISQQAAALSESNAAASAAQADANATTTTADRIQTNLDASATAADAAATSADATQTAQDAQTSTDNASNSTISANAASASASAAANSALNAVASETNATANASAALASQAAASTSELNAGVFASDAEQYSIDAEVSKISATASAVSAEQSANSIVGAVAQTAADVLITNADVVATNADVILSAANAAAALASENAAAGSEASVNADATTASNAAVSATASATTATNAANAASTSETNAAASASSAASDASTILGSVASTSADAAAAASSASAASASETAAATSEANAATSETNAAASETSAASSESAALTSQNAAAISATQAANSASALSSGVIPLGPYDASSGAFPVQPNNLNFVHAYHVVASGTMTTNGPVGQSALTVATNDVLYSTVNTGIWYKIIGAAVDTFNPAQDQTITGEWEMTNTANVFYGDGSNLTGLPDPDLTPYALISSVPTDNNQLANGAGYITSAGDVATVNGHSVETDVPAGAVFTDTVYNDTAVYAAIPTDNSELSNGAGYVTSSGNTVIGTDSDINTSGAAVVEEINVTDGVITSMTTRTMTLANLGYTGATNANYITNNNQLTNGKGYITGYTVTSGDVTGALGYTPYQEGTGLSASSITASGSLTVPDINAEVLKVSPVVNASLSVNFDDGDFRVITPSASGQITFTAPSSSSKCQTVTLKIINTGKTITWPTGTKFSKGTAVTPTLNGVDYVGIIYDASDSSFVVLPIAQEVS